MDADSFHTRGEMKNGEMNGIPLYLLSFVWWQIIRHASERVDYLVWCVKYLVWQNEGLHDDKVFYETKLRNERNKQ